MSNQPLKKKRSHHCTNPKCTQSFPSHDKLKEHMIHSLQLGLHCKSHLLHCDHCNKPFVYMKDLRKHLSSNKECNKHEVSIDEDTSINHKTIHAYIEAGNSLLSKGDARGYNIEMATMNQIRHQYPEFYQHSLQNRMVFNSRFQLANISHKLNDVSHSKSNLLRNAYNEIDDTNADATFVTFLDDLEATNEEEDEVINQQYPHPQQFQIHGSILDHIYKKEEWDFSNGKNPIEEILSADLLDEDMENGLDSIDNIKDDLLRTRANVSSSPIQRALIKLYKLVFKVGGDSLYKKVVEWATDHFVEIGSLAKQGYTPDIQSMVKNELYGTTYKHLFKPKVNSIILSSGRKVTIPTFSFFGAITDLLVSRMNADVATPTHENNNTHYDELGSGSWWNRANSTLCTQPHEAIEPIIGFIDAVAIGQYGKKSMIPAMFTLSSFTINARQKEDNWRVFAFIDHKNQLPSLKNAAKQKMIEYHEIMSVAFAELFVLQKYGFKWTSKHLDGSLSVQKIKVPLQLLIGDCEGAGDLCGRVPSHLRTIPCLCRSCDVPHNSGHDHARICNYLKQNIMLQKSEEDLKDLAFYKLPNPFYQHLCFGHDENGIFGCTPNEVLHQFEQGLCDYIVEAVLNQMKGRARDLINSICIYICDSFSSQSERKFPSLLAFRKGFSTTAKLTGKERFARLVMLQIIFCCTDFVKYICTNKKRGTDYSTDH